MTPFPPAPSPGSPVSASWMRRFLAACRASMPLEGIGTRLQHTPNGTFIHVRATAASATEPLKPFTVRWHQPADADGQWEIYMPAGCMSCGSTCFPANVAAHDTEGHGGEDGEPGWYILPLDESQGQQKTDADGHSYRSWSVTIHAKTSAKIQGEDTVDAVPRHLAFASAWTENPAQNSSDVDESAIGDEFSQVVAGVRVTTSGQGKIRKVFAYVSSPISVQAHVKSNFDLEWWFTRDNANLELDKVYAVRNDLSVAGMVVKGDTKIDVTAAWATDGNTHDIYAIIRSNPQDPAENIVEVQVDNSNQGNTSGEFTTKLLLYIVKNGGVDIYTFSDARSSSLSNIQIYR